MQEVNIRGKYVQEFIDKAKKYIEMPKLTPELLRVFIRKSDVMRWRRNIRGLVGIRL